MSIDPDIMEELERYDEEFKPSETIKPSIDNLADGDYNFEILDAGFSRTMRSRDLIFRINLRVMGGASDGEEAEWASWFKNQQNVDILGGSLVALGLDADKWNAANDRPFSKELVKSLPKLRGIRFRAKKVTKDSYANLRIQYLLSKDGPLPASRLSAAPPARPTARPEPAAVNNSDSYTPPKDDGSYTPPKDDGSDIPF